MSSVTAYVALGANLGPREAAVREAARRLHACPGLAVLALSPLYETLAVADEPQPLYVNAVARLTSALDAIALLHACLAIERAMGRVRPPGQSKASRTIDLDLLLHGAEVLEGPGLSLPHPGLLARPFVRIPLVDVAEAGLRHPVTGEVLDRAAPDFGVRRLDGTRATAAAPPWSSPDSAVHHVRARTVRLGKQG